MVTVVLPTVIAISVSTCICSTMTMYSLTIFFMGRVGGRFMDVQMPRFIKGWLYKGNGYCSIPYSNCH